MILIGLNKGAAAHTSGLEGKLKDPMAPKAKNHIVHYIFISCTFFVIFIIIIVFIIYRLKT
jgi:hypothetical protein